MFAAADLWSSCDGRASVMAWREFLRQPARRGMDRKRGRDPRHGPRTADQGQADPGEGQGAERTPVVSVEARLQRWRFRQKRSPAQGPGQEAGSPTRLGRKHARLKHTRHNSDLCPK